MQAQDIEMFREQAKAELNRLEAQSSAKDVAGKAIGKQALLYIFLTIVVGVGASIVLEESKIAAVMGLLGSALVALIQMLNGIAGASPKQEKPEFEVIRALIDKLDRLDRAEQPMRVDVEGDRVTVRKGDDVVTARKDA